ncbi:recombinase family protein [Bradyrhizobium sp. CCBAU 21359]|uniref:recombinase family protein n=1 Tax=Bradyrhizobium sp. CCBAU 21359 TaxID=1325080 RepID=UPI00230576AE|nr:recombinase family protein [Bradyrhizobium sp. CCBAU 21359]
MSKITPEHLARQTVVYTRQSTADHVINNRESQRRQYGLTDRALQLGRSKVVVIDDDLGRFSGGTARFGFEKPRAAICEGRVGAVVSIEASRLARNGGDCHTLLEFCGLVGTLIVDEDGVYDPRHSNDRLLLGMKGTMSEMERPIFRQRSLEALKQKARRGELFLNVAIGSQGLPRSDRERTLIGAFRGRSHSCSPSLPRCRHCARSTSGYGRSESLCPRPPRRMEVTGVQYDLPNPD